MYDRAMNVLSTVVTVFIYTVVVLVMASIAECCEGHENSSRRQPCIAAGPGATGIAARNTTAGSIVCKVANVVRFPS